MGHENAATILVLEDDPTIAGFLEDNLRADGYVVAHAPSVRRGREVLEEVFPDVVLADVTLPDGSGLELVQAIRGADGLTSCVDPRTPILVLSGRASETERLRAFEQGADDMLPKPFSYPELRARIAALLRRADDRPVRSRVAVGPLVLDPTSRDVRVHGRRIDLAGKEYALLRALATEPTRVYTKDELLRTIWGLRGTSSTRTLDSHACRLRQKLSDGGARLVVNVWGVGYRLVDTTEGRI